MKPRTRRGSSSDQVGTQVVFWVAGRALALPIEAVREVVEAADVVAIPDTIPFVLGITSLRGAILAVLDTERLVFEQKTTVAKQLLVLVRDEQLIAALAVERVEGVFALRHSTKLAATSAERFLSEVHDLGLASLVSRIDLSTLMHYVDASRPTTHLFEVAE
jgi:chemotaxis signal transduction protein